MKLDQHHSILEEDYDEIGIINHDLAATSLTEGQKSTSFLRGDYSATSSVAPLLEKPIDTLKSYRHTSSNRGMLELEKISKPSSSQHVEEHKKTTTHYSILQDEEEGDEAEKPFHIVDDTVLNNSKLTPTSRYDWSLKQSNKLSQPILSSSFTPLPPRPNPISNPSAPMVATGKKPRSKWFLVRLYDSIPTANENQRKTFRILLVQFIVAMIIWNINYGEHILYPFHVIGVLFHELGHAFAGFITGASIISIRIGPRVDGTTVILGGWPCVVYPAGYLGSSLAGALLLFCGFSELASLYLSYLIAGACILTLFFAVDIFTFVTSLFTFIIFAGLGFFEGPKRGMIIRWSVLMMGILASTFAFWDIIGDLVIRTHPSSDAYKFASECLYCPAALVGIVWLLMTIIFIYIAVVLALHFFPRSDTLNPSSKPFWGAALMSPLPTYPKRYPLSNV